MLRTVHVVQGLSVIRETKFYKSRLVPFGPKLAALLVRHLRRRQTEITEVFAGDQPLFTLFRGRSINPSTISQVFHALVPRLRLTVPPGVSPPRLHDLRHYLRSLTMSGGARAEFCATGELPIAWNGCLICHPT